MTLGETLDEIRSQHEDNIVVLARDAGEHHADCELCRALARIQKAYEEMIANLKIVDLNKPIDILKAP